MTSSRRRFGDRVPDDGTGRGPHARGLIAVVNSAFENVYFPDKNTVGKQIVLGNRGPATIVGVVADLKQEGIDRPAQPAAFVPSTQIVPGAVTFFVRGRGD
jgi:hypothetical protein